MSLMIISAILAHWFNFRWARILCRVFCFIAIGTTFLDFINGKQAFSSPLDIFSLIIGLLVIIACWQLSYRVRWKFREHKQLMQS
jgi:uncharacterized membrane protein YfcA